MPVFDARAALVELVQVRDLRAEYLRRKQRRDVQRLRADPVKLAELHAMKEELDRREPEAWAQARRIVNWGAR